MKSALYVSVVLIYSIYRLAAVLGDVPHPQCFVTGTTLVCKRAFLEFPTNFNVHKIPQHIHFIHLECPSTHSGEPAEGAKYYCNTLHNNLEPIPYRPALAKVDLRGFKAADGGRIPLNQLLLLVKHQITELTLRWSRIGHLDGEFFRGFRSLMFLDLASNDIESIAADMFQSLTESVNVESKLRLISLGHNGIQELDFAAFRPVANSLSRLLVSGQTPGLRLLKQTGQQFQLRLDELSLENNALNFIAKDVLDTVVPRNSNNFLFNAVGNQFCLSVNDCSCCEMEDLVSWMLRIRSTQPKAVVKFSCASREVAQDGPNLNLETHRHCKKVPLTKPFCSKQKTLEANCTADGLRVTNQSLENANLTAVVFASDGAYFCGSKLNYLHHAALEQFGLTTRISNRSDLVQADCSNGSGSLNVFDPDRSTAKVLTFSSDLSDVCRSRMDGFLTRLREVLDDSLATVTYFPADGSCYLFDFYEN